jgi:hypothetical protein
VMSINPDTGEFDGPFVALGGTEYTLPEAAALGHALIAIAEAAHDGDGPGANGPAAP